MLHYGDLTDSTNLIRILQLVQPDEVYNLAAQSHVAVSFESPEYTADTDGLGTLRILEGIRLLGMEKRPGFIRHLRRNYLVRCRKPRRLKPHLLSSKSLCCGQALCLLDNGQLQGSVWDLRLQWYFV